MKKTFFYALLFAAASMTFVGCKKEVSRAEQAVRAVEAAKSFSEIEEIDKEYSDLKPEDFTPEQQERIEKAIENLMK